MKCISKEEGEKQAKAVHEQRCRELEPYCIGRCKSIGGFWPNMGEQYEEIQEQCSWCQEKSETNMIEEGDWR